MYAGELQDCSDRTSEGGVVAGFDAGVAAGWAMADVAKQLAIRVARANPRYFKPV